MWRFAIVSIISLLSCSFPAFAQVQCIDADGEAAVVNGDVPSARAEAVSRAKLAAIEQTVGVGVNAQTVVQNLVLVDEAVSRHLYGGVTTFKMLSQKSEGDLVSVTIHACVEPAKARDAVSDLALNNAVAVFVPVRKISASGAVQGYHESSGFSEEMIGDLTDRGYTVVDVAPTGDVDATSIDAAIKSGNLRSLSSMMCKFLTNVVLVGTIEIAVSTRKGGNIGFGLNTPFHNVTARLNYRLVTRDPSGRIVILAAGSEQGKGLAGTMEDATAKGLRNLAAKLKPVIADRVARHVKASAKMVQVKVDGIRELGENFAVKEVLQNIAWVTKVEEKELGRFAVGYPENTIYLANSIAQKSIFRIIDFSANTITVQYTK
ncbi:hypothetical protein [Geotalea sp. SG265]|uniref:hypothetical protein n=1 Tax=Geotalea sp. SG265 TaxID=2922867 RepID=UPI001FAF0825|nr:hypothetical protein [Geotalea sp. SG265]